MYKKFYWTALALSAAPMVALAQTQGSPTDNVTPIAQQFLTLLKVIVSIVFVVALVMFGWGIVKLITAGGDPTAVQTAKGYIIWGVIGMAVLASLFGLITFLQTYFGVSPTAGNFEIPTIPTSAP